MFAQQNLIQSQAKSYNSKKYQQHNIRLFFESIHLVSFINKKGNNAAVIIY